MSRSQFYRITKSLKDGTYTQSQRGRYAMRWTRTGILIADITEAVREDGQLTVWELAHMYDVSVYTITTILHEDIRLSKKSARWVPKLLTNEQKCEWVQVCQQFVRDVQNHCKDYLNTILTMDKTMISLPTPKTEKQSEMWISKGEPGKEKAQVQASWTKHMAIVFFDLKGLIYTNIVLKGKSVNSANIMMALDRSRTAVAVKDWLTARSIPVLKQAPY